MLSYVGKLFTIVLLVLYISFLWIVIAPMYDMLMEFHLSGFGHVRRILIESLVRGRVIETQ